MTRGVVMTRTWHEEAVAALEERPGVGLLRDIPLSDHTYIGIGGPARVLIEPETVEDLAWAIARLHAQGLPFDVLGAGSNLLVSDDGPSFVVISCAGLGDVPAIGRGAGVAGARGWGAPCGVDSATAVGTAGGGVGRRR
jgi:hypothetical protein